MYLKDYKRQYEANLEDDDIEAIDDNEERIKERFAATQGLTNQVKTCGGNRIIMLELKPHK